MRPETSCGVTFVEWQSRQIDSWLAFFARCMFRAMRAERSLKRTL